MTRNTRYLGFLGVFFFVAFAAYVPQPLSPNYLSNQQGLSLSRIGELISIAYLGNTLLNLLLGQLEARTGFILGQLGSGGLRRHPLERDRVWLVCRGVFPSGRISCAARTGGGAGACLRP